MSLKKNVIKSVVTAVMVKSVDVVKGVGGCCELKGEGVGKGDEVIHCWVTPLCLAKPTTRRRESRVEPPTVNEGARQTHY
ncbi:hypothetical protein Pmani_008875 [Petrolisthes manimaculis]|uniref:Uncharacterized protein n=1 Tax=Petrolisthes manimaculis TaxID=1843537 RepID=A0AAE1Q5H5_9EUCA|nr:hypothetical protein Pmani_008875 [Petrolisthes manimaculis]